MGTPPPPAYAGSLGPAWSLLRAGQVRRAEAELDAIAREGALTDAQRALFGALRIDIRLATGDVTGAAEAATRIPRGRDGVTTLAAELGNGEVAAAFGDHAAALEHFLAAGEYPGHDEDMLRPWWVGAALAMVRTGRRHDGAALVRSRVEAAEAPYALAQGLRALATAETGHDPVGLLRRARTVAAALGDLRLGAQLDTDVAALMLLQPAGHPAAEAVDLLRDAERYTAAEGLWPLHRRIARLLERSGERARPLAGQTLARLTPAERRVARLAASGLTNRQIADALALTVKGVEWHLSRVYRRLGIGSRAALAGLLDTRSASEAS
jgi:DNA-binding CsgD family transcriptional regulator